MVFGRKKKESEPGTKQIAAPRPGSIGEHVAAGGKLPGEEGFDAAAIQADVDKRKADKKEINKTFGADPRDAFKGAINQTPARIPLDAVDIRTEKDGSTSFRDKDELIHIIYPDGREEVEQPGLAMPITAEDIAGLGLKGFFTKGLLKNLGRTGGKEVTEVFSNPNVFAKGSITGIIANTKNIKISKSLLGKFFSRPAMVIYGGWASAVFLGLWGQAESVEPIQIPLRDAIRQAKFTGDWSTVRFAEQKMFEISDLKIWEKIALLSPIAPFIGIPSKIKGVRAGAIVLSKIAEDEQILQATGQSETDYWEQRDEEKAQQFRENTDYHNEQSLIYTRLESEAIAAAQATNRAEERKAYQEYGEYLAGERAKEREREAKDREEIAKFWIAYTKEKKKLDEDNRPSNLNFGLI